MTDSQDIMNPFSKAKFLDIPTCPKCKKEGEKWYSFFFCIHADLYQNIDGENPEEWCHMKCHNCTAPSANRFYCEKKNYRNQEHGAYSRSDYPFYKDNDNSYYCQDCYCKLFLGV